jgi:hypothetical protein
MRISGNGAGHAVRNRVLVGVSTICTVGIDGCQVVLHDAKSDFDREFGSTSGAFFDPT